MIRTLFGRVHACVYCILYVVFTHRARARVYRVNWFVWRAINRIVSIAAVSPPRAHERSTQSVRGYKHIIIVILCYRVHAVCRTAPGSRGRTKRVVHGFANGTVSRPGRKRSSSVRQPFAPIIRRFEQQVSLNSYLSGTKMSVVVCIMFNVQPHVYTVRGARAHT